MLAPVPVWLVGLEKIVAGALQSIIAAAVVFPIVYLVHAHGGAPVVRIHDWPLFVAAVVFASLLAAALGLFIGTVIDPRKITLLFSVVLLPITFLGCVVLPVGGRSRRLPWLQYLVLVDPLVYMTEGAAGRAHPAAAAHGGLGLAARARRRLRRARGSSRCAPSRRRVVRLSSRVGRPVPGVPPGGQLEKATSAIPAATAPAPAKRARETRSFAPIAAIPRRRRRSTRAPPRRSRPGRAGARAARSRRCRRGARRRRSAARTLVAERGALPRDAETSSA